MAQQYIDLLGSIEDVDARDLALIARHLSVHPGTVLDVGCGPGHHTAHLRALGVDAIGLDMVPEFIEHARTAHPGGRFVLGSLHQLPVPERSLAGVLAWYSLIHLAPTKVDAALAELRRALAPGGTLVVGFFDGDDVVAFEHQVTTAYYWPVDELAARLTRAGFIEIERQQRPGIAAPGLRPHAAIVATVK